MLYSVLHREAIRNAARERGLGDFLQVNCKGRLPIWIVSVGWGEELPLGNPPPPPPPPLPWQPVRQVVAT